MRIKARSKFLDIKNNFTPRQLYSVIGYVLFLSLMAVIIFAWIQDWLISLTFLLCAVIGFFLFTQSPKDLEVEINEENLLIDEFSYKLDEIISWALVDLGDTLEIVIRTKSFSSPFTYFYIADNNGQNTAFINQMRQQLVYDPQTARQNYIHNTLRFLNLK